jgi:hypothetical protein
MDSVFCGFFEDVLKIVILGSDVSEDLHEKFEVVNFPVEMCAFDIASEKFGEEVLLDERRFR